MKLRVIRVPRGWQYEWVMAPSAQKHEYWPDTLGGDWRCKVWAVPMHPDEARDVARNLRSAESSEMTYEEAGGVADVSQ
jgi:hypothetical protein